MVIDIPENADFSIHNIPFGIFSTPDKSPRIGVAVGDHVMDLVVLSNFGVFNFDVSVLVTGSLNAFIALGKAVTSKVRTDIQALLQDENSPLIGHESELFHKQSDVKMHMPVHVGDYTDFYSSIEHATNVGKMFRDPDNALLPNWKHIPVGYHGRASSIVESGIPIKRPKGQVMPPNAEKPIYQASSRLDFELEMGFIIGKDTSLGETISTEQAEEYIFGKVIFNDWSARDIQKWEYVPLGPFLAKNFGSSISPWVVTMEALAPFRTEGPAQDPEVLPYLQYSGEKNFNINLEVGITPENGAEEIVSRSNFRYMYWNMSQQLAHHTVNGCNVNVGDMMASGTISGPTADSYGSMLELAWAGSKPLKMKDGSERKFIQDHDTVTMRAYCQKEGIRVGFGEVSTQVLPAN